MDLEVEAVVAAPVAAARPAEEAACRVVARALRAEAERPVEGVPVRHVEEQLPHGVVPGPVLRVEAQQRETGRQRASADPNRFRVPAVVRSPREVVVAVSKAPPEVPQDVPVVFR